MSSQAAAGSYRRLLGEPALRRIAVADVCARLPQGMTSITLLLVAAQHAAMAVASLVLAGYTLGAAVTGPARGRLADRRGLPAVAAACGAGYVVALLGLLACSAVSGPAWLLVLTGTAAGLLLPPFSPGVRSLWSSGTAAGLRQVAFALDAAVFYLSAIAGPVLASVLATGIAPAAALGLVLVLTGAGVAAVGTPSSDTAASMALLPIPVPAASPDEAGDVTAVGKPGSVHLEMQPPPAWLARRLRLAAGQPAVLVTTRFDDPEQRRPVALTIAVFRPNLFRIVVQAEEGPLADSGDASFARACAHAAEDREA